MFTYPQTSNSEKSAATNLTYGIHPLARINAAAREKLEKSPLAVKDTASLTISARHIELLKSCMDKETMTLNEARLPADLTQVEFRVVAVYFDDGTDWSCGKLYRADPNARHKRIPLNQESRQE